MSFWQQALSWLSNYEGVTPNANGPADITPGDPDGLEILGEPVESRALPFPVASPWSGWPGEWATPSWGQLGMNKLVDTAWACLDLNSRVLSAMPVYRTQSGRIISSPQWMTNPDPTIYTSWQEFAKQLFWDFQMGEVFILPMARFANGTPRWFRVVPPWLMNVELTGGGRSYMLGRQDVTGEVLHIRYQSSTTDARGHGPLEVAGARMTAVKLLQRYADRIAETGGTPMYWMEIDRKLTPMEANDLLDVWVESRKRHAGEPAVVSGKATLHQANQMSARDMTLLELAQFNEARVATLFGVPPHLVGLPSGSDSMTYKNAEGIYEFHDRSSLKPLATAVMSALSYWGLPSGQSAELNRDEYSRPGLKERAEANKIMFEAGALTAEEWRAQERLSGAASATALTGDTTGAETSTDPIPARPAGGNQT